MQNLLSSENITLDHSAAVQSRRFWRCLLFKSGLTQGMRQLKPMSCIRLCVVVLGPAAVHSLWISPTFLNGFVSQSSPGCGYPYCLYTFSTTSFPSLRLSINVLGHRALWTASLFCNDLLCLALLVQGVNGRLLDNCQVSSLPHDCVAYRNRQRPFKGLCRCFELISWLECGNRCLQYWTFSQYSNFLRYWIWGFH